MSANGGVHNEDGRMAKNSGMAAGVSRGWRRKELGS